MSEFKFKKKFIERLSDLLEGGIGLIEAIKIIEKSLKDKEKTKVTKLRKALEQGKNLERAFENISTNKEFLVFIKTAEKTGDLKYNLKLLKEKYDFISNIKSEIFSILAYPIIVILLSISILIVLLGVVVPKFVEIYQDLGQELPTITKIIIYISNFLNSNKLIIFLLLILTIVSIYIILKTNKNLKDYIFINLPFVKEFIILNFTQSMYAAFASKLNFIDAINLCMDSYNNSFKKELIRIYKRIEKGESISFSFSNSKLFDDEYKSYMIIADSTGELEESFKTLSVILNNRLRYKIKIYLKILEPISIVIIAILVGIIVLSVMLPLFNLGENIK